MLSREEILRYDRQLLLPEMGFAGQEKLKNAKVLVIGAGGLGCPVLLYLTAMGIGKIGVIDFDKVDISNLHRQVLYNDSDIGKPKAIIVKEKLENQNPWITIQAYNEKLTTQNALKLFYEYDIIIDGTDNFDTRYLVNDASFLLKKILVSGSVFKFEGQVSVYNFSKKDTPTYRCLYPKPPAGGAALSCSETGILGVLPGIIGTLMVNETVKIIAGIEAIADGQLLIVQLKNLEFQKFEFKRNEEAVNLIPKNENEFMEMDYELFCA